MVFAVPWGTFGFCLSFAAPGAILLLEMITRSILPFDREVQWRSLPWSTGMSTAVCCLVLMSAAFAHFAARRGIGFLRSVMVMGLVAVFSFFVMGVSTVIFDLEPRQWSDPNQELRSAVFLVVFLEGAWFFVFWQIRRPEVASQPRHFRFQFSLRTLLLLVLLVSLGMSWLATRIGQTDQECRIADSIESHQGDLCWGIEIRNDRFYGSYRPSKDVLPWNAYDAVRFLESPYSIFRTIQTVSFARYTDRHPTLMTRTDFAMSADVLSQIGHLKHLRQLNLAGTNTTDEMLAGIQNMRSLEELNLQRTAITDDGLKHLRRFHRLRHLNVSETRVTGVGFDYLDGLTHLEVLNLDGTPITSEGLASLQGLRSLDYLDLQTTTITDNAVDYLARMSNLRCVCLGGTNVTDAGIERLRHLRPSLKIDREWMLGGWVRVDCLERRWRGPKPTWPITPLWQSRPSKADSPTNLDGKR